MVQNKSGMTSDSLVDIAELIPDAVKYEVSSLLTIMKQNHGKYCDPK